mgnify:CR=1 FL=1
MFLATTALNKFWEIETPTLFLGQWCIKYSDQEKFNDLTYNIMDYPWDDETSIDHSIDYCRKIFELVLNELVMYMNHIHNTNYTKRYWQIILGHWLLHYIHVFYDRYICLKQAFNSIFLSACAEIFPEEYFPTPSKTSTTVMSLPFNLPGKIEPP